VLQNHPRRIISELMANFGKYRFPVSFSQLSGNFVWLLYNVEQSSRSEISQILWPLKIFSNYLSIFIENYLHELRKFKTLLKWSPSFKWNGCVYTGIKSIGLLYETTFFYYLFSCYTIQQVEYPSFTNAPCGLHVRTPCADSMFTAIFRIAMYMSYGTTKVILVFYL
jgi:hypothetical protein